MSHALIYHITSRAEWSAAQGKDAYTAASLEKQGFIHCSKVGQLLRVANDFYSGQGGLVILEIDPELLRADLRWEPGDDLKTELFPHIYGAINLDAVTDVLDFATSAQGSFSLPPKLARSV